MKYVEKYEKLFLILFIFYKGFEKGKKMDLNAKQTIGEALEREQLTKDDMKYFKKQHETENDEKINTTEMHPSDENNEEMSSINKFVSDHILTIASGLIYLGVVGVGYLIGKRMIANGISEGILKAMKNTYYVIK